LDNRGGRRLVLLVVVYELNDFSTVAGYLCLSLDAELGYGRIVGYSEYEGSFCTRFVLLIQPDDVYVDCYLDLGR